jgi:hypothetical protein
VSALACKVLRLYATMANRVAIEYRTNFFMCC